MKFTLNTNQRVEYVIFYSISISVVMFSALPFIGFGFLDNVIMILAVSKTYSFTLL